MMTVMTVIRNVSIDQTATSQHYGISKNIKFNKKKTKTKRKRPPLFPQKLYNLLENAETEGYDHLIGWSPDGKSFKIHSNGKDPAIVAILEQNFNQTRFKSFLRQLQLYGFERQFTGDSRDERSHPMLVRGRKDLLHKKSVEEFQDAAANDTAEYKPTEYPSSSAEQLLYNSCKKEISSSSLLLLSPVSAVSSTTTEPISFSKNHSNGKATNCWQSPTATTSSTLVTNQQQQQSSFDVVTPNIPTKLVNLVLRDCDDDNDDDDTSDSINSINVFSRNIFDATTYDDSSISSNEDGNDYADTADDDDIHIATIRNNVYPQWAGSSMELEILKTI